ncbi:MAG TPA: phosphoenolpyruvate carboxykinase (ATP), partial [Gemmatimonadetes bacterium]|nr:phosphoenolpyruvate carboxykinase (ATP) [Gemmatimonadota bacterium]
WSGGGYGVGRRMRLDYTRSMVNAALGGQLDDVEYLRDPVFSLATPATVSGVPEEILQPRGTWSDGAAYDISASKLAEMFRKNFEQFADRVSEEVREAGPQ